jgi:hypothetical protein
LPPPVDALDPGVAVGASREAFSSFRRARVSCAWVGASRRAVTPPPWAFAERWHYVNIAPVCYPFGRHHAALLFSAATTGNGQIASIVALHRLPSKCLQPVERGPEAAVLDVPGR